MKKLVSLLLLLLAVSGYAQKKPKKDTTATRRWVREYVSQQLKSSPTPPTTTVAVVTTPPCKTGLDLLTVTPTSEALDFTFQAVDVQAIDWTVTKAGVSLATGNTGKLTSAQVRLPLKLLEGHYELQIKATNCSSDPQKGRKSFVVAPVVATPSTEAVTTSTKNEDGAAIRLEPLTDPLLPSTFQTGNYELRYIESRPDYHLDLQLSEKDGQLFLTDVGNSLTSVSYTLNGWTDENAGKLDQEPIIPYRLYHLSKYSVARPSLRETWMALYANPKADFRRSEVFFYVVPKTETWNPVGESPNPIGRPLAFAKLPPFQLTNRQYGFEYDLLDETDARKKELSIQFNWQPGKRHLKIYASDLRAFIETLPSRKGFHDFTEQEAIAFANSLSTDQIMAFDFEPGGDAWIVDYNSPGFSRNMATVLHRLRERGALAYNWMDIEGQSPNIMQLDGLKLSPNAGYGHNNADVGKYEQAYQRLGDLQKRNNPNAVINTGFGYVSYDNNFAATDANGQNSSPQLTYLKALDASELWRRAWPDKDQVYFSWAFQEENFVTFPGNHVVEIPAFQARARRTDNKPLYPPDYWQDNLTLGLTNAKYLFYWCPGPVSWNPASVSSYNSAYTKGFSVWTYEQGLTPQSNAFYIGKELMALNATVKAAYTYSLIQGAMDGSRLAPSFSFARAAKDGSLSASQQVSEIRDGSWYVKSLIGHSPFCVVFENNGQKVVFFQDVWSRPGRFTDFEFTYAGRRYQGRTEGNRLFIAHL